MNFIEAIKMVYERDAVIKRKTKNYCIYKNKRTDRLRRLSFNKTGGVIYENYSLLSDAESLNDDWVVTSEYDNLIARDNLVHRKLPISKLPKKRLTYASILDKK
jgi:hypothetical protein